MRRKIKNQQLHYSNFEKCSIRRVTNSINERELRRVLRAARVAMPRERRPVQTLHRTPEVSYRATRHLFHASELLEARYLLEQSYVGWF
jgi:hypothetical protein